MDKDTGNRIKAGSGNDRLLELNSILSQLKTQYSMSPEQIVELVEQKDDRTIPLSIYRNRELGIMELTVKYMKEAFGYSYSDIAKMLGRDQRTIWVMYNNAIRKSPQMMQLVQPGMQPLQAPVHPLSNVPLHPGMQAQAETPEYYLPISIFTDREKGVLQVIVVYLKHKYGLRFSEIGRLLNRDARIICTVYHKIGGN